MKDRAQLNWLCYPKPKRLFSRFLAAEGLTHGLRDNLSYGTLDVGTKRVRQFLGVSKLLSVGSFGLLKLTYVLKN